MQQISILTILFTLLAISASWAQFAGGSGTEEDPYQIATIEQLQAMADSTHQDKHFIQVADIDAAETAGWHGGKGFVPIGSGNSFDNAFTGTFDGQGYVISNLSIIRNEENDVGLFGYAISRAKIHNVHLDQVKVHGRDRVGGLVGSGEGFMVEQSGTSGQVIGNKFVGGLVGVSGAWINKSYTLSDVTGEENAGGLVGLVYDGGINESFSTGNVKGSDVIGGLVGSGMFIHNSYATGDVTGNR